MHHREPVSVDDLALYPLFTDEIIELMRSLLPLDRLEAVATSVIVTAKRRAEALSS